VPWIPTWIPASTGVAGLPSTVGLVQAPKLSLEGPVVVGMIMLILGWILGVLYGLYGFYKYIYIYIQDLRD